jgi:hypothetical protein
MVEDLDTCGDLSPWPPWIQQFLGPSSAQPKDPGLPAKWYWKRPLAELENPIFPDRDHLADAAAPPSSIERVIYSEPSSRRARQSTPGRLWSSCDLYGHLMIYFVVIYVVMMIW